MASKTEEKNLWSLPSSSRKDKFQSFPTAMKVAEAMLQHEVVVKNYRASPASTRFIFSLLPKRSSTNVTSDVGFVLSVDTRYTAKKEREKGIKFHFYGGLYLPVVEKITFSPWKLTRCKSFSSFGAFQILAKLPRWKLTHKMTSQSI